MIQLAVPSADIGQADHILQFCSSGNDGNEIRRLRQQLRPEMNGFEVLRRLRADEATKSIPVIILSALNSNDDVAKGIAMGAEDYITKPIIMERLQNSVIEQLNKLFG